MYLLRTGNSWQYHIELAHYLPRESGHLRPETESDQMDVLQVDAGLDQEAQEARQIASHLRCVFH